MRFILTVKDPVKSWSWGDSWFPSCLRGSSCDKLLITRGKALRSFNDRNQVGLFMCKLLWHNGLLLNLWLSVSNTSFYTALTASQMAACHCQLVQLPECPLKLLIKTPGSDGWAQLGVGMIARTWLQHFNPGDQPTSSEFGRCLHHCLLYPAALPSVNLDTKPTLTSRYSNMQWNWQVWISCDNA